MKFVVPYNDDPQTRLTVNAVVDDGSVVFTAKGHEPARANLQYVLGANGFKLKGLSSEVLMDGVLEYISKRLRKSSSTMGLDGRSVRKERAILFQKVRDSKPGDRFYFYGHLLEVMEDPGDNDGLAEYGICSYNQGMYLARWCADQGRWNPHSHTRYHSEWHRVIRFVRVLEFK